MFVALFSGDRRWKDEDAVARELRALQAEHGLDLLVVQGGAPGLDTIAKELCDQMGIDTVTFWPNWNGRITSLGAKYAGPYRNRLMLDLLPVQLVVAFHPWLPRSKGTKDMVDRAVKRGIPVKVCGDQSGAYTGRDPIYA
jgi:hypothetical protein